jgi:hypothetical protein
MTFTTLLPNSETKLEEGTYRIKKGDVSSPAIVRGGKIRFLLSETNLEGKVSYRKL